MNFAPQAVHFALTLLAVLLLAGSPARSAPQPTPAPSPEAPKPPSATPPAPTRAELQESRVRVTFSGGLSPFESVRYEVFGRRDAAVVLHSRELAGYSDTLLETALLTWDEVGALWQALLAARVFDLEAPPRPKLPGGPRVTIEAKLGAQHARLEIPDPLSQDDPRYELVVDAVRRVALTKAGDVPFRDVFIPPSRLGWLNVTSVPVATVSFDGRETGEETPLYGYELAAGEHTIRLRNPKRGVDRTYTFTIQPGMTTLLELELR